MKASGKFALWSLPIALLIYVGVKHREYFRETTAWATSERSRASMALSRDTRRTAAVAFDTVHVDRLYPAMHGPNRHEILNLDLPPGDRTFWVLGAKVELKKRAAREAERIDGTQFLCHSRFGYAPVRDKHDLAKIRMMNDYSRPSSVGTFVQLSQGLTEVRFPPGFGLVVPAPMDARKILFGAQIQNTSEKVPFDVGVSATLDYMDLESGKAAGLKELQFATVYIKAPPCDEQQMDHEHSKEHYGLSLEWMVPPGKHVYTEPVSPRRFGRIGRGGKIHFIRMHVHPFGTSIELFDKTTQRSLWKGFATTDSKRGIVTRADHYSSGDGIPIDTSHEFELRADFDNTTDKPIDAMAALALYVAAASD